jgi:protein-S-isoprenylcysteine O-methyltransferase Ste14
VADHRADEISQRPAPFPWPPVLAAATIASAVVLGHWQPLPWPGLDDAPARLIGTGFGLAGVALMIWAGHTLSRHHTTVMPHKRSDALVTSGPFRFRRNPIYLGWVLVFLGLAELTKNVWLVAGALVFALLVTWLAILPEERHLEARFGEAYRAYKATTRRWI